MPELILTDDHRYLLDGKPLDGLTSTIKEAGLISNYGSEWHMNKGTAVHLATEYFDRGTLDEDTLDPQIQGYLESWKRFRKDQDYTPKYIEYPIYHPELMVGMKIDRLPGPTEIKSGTKEPHHILQVAMQYKTAVIWKLYDYSKDIPMTVYLNPDGGPPKIEQYNFSQIQEAFKVYASMLHFLRWRREKYGINAKTNH